MAIPTLTPSATTNAIVLSSTGDTTAVASNLPFGTYASTDYWTEEEVNIKTIDIRMKALSFIVLVF